MSTCRPLARLFLSPRSAHSLKCGRALSVVKGQGRNKLLSLTVRHWSFQSRFQLREVSLVKGEFLLFQHPASADHHFACVRSILTYLVTLSRYLNNFYILTGKTNSFKKLLFTILRFRIRILLCFELAVLNLPLHFWSGLIHSYFYVILWELYLLCLSFMIKRWIFRSNSFYVLKYCVVLELILRKKFTILKICILIHT